MPYDMYLQIDGIKGDSTDDAHKDWIEVVSYSHGISQPSGASLSAEGAHSGGRADHQDLPLFPGLTLIPILLLTHGS